MCINGNPKFQEMFAQLGQKKNAGYGPQPAPTPGAAQIARGADPTLHFAAVSNKLGLKQPTQPVAPVARPRM